MTEEERKKIRSLQVLYIVQNDREVLELMERGRLHEAFESAREDDGGVRISRAMIDRLADAYMKRGWTRSVLDVLELGASRKKLLEMYAYYYSLDRGSFTKRSGLKRVGALLEKTPAEE